MGYNKAHWSPVTEKMRPATIAMLSMGRCNEELLWCDRLANSVWQDPGNHKGRTVALYSYWSKQIRAAGMCAWECMHFCPFIYPVATQLSYIMAHSHLVSSLHLYMCLLRIVLLWLLRHDEALQWEVDSCEKTFFIIKEWVSSSQMHS